MDSHWQKIEEAGRVFQNPAKMQAKCKARSIGERQTLKSSYQHSARFGKSLVKLENIETNSHTELKILAFHSSHLLLCKRILLRF